MSIFKSLLGFYDVLHRGAVFGLVGIAGWGLFMMGAAHFSIMRRGKGTSYVIQTMIFTNIQIYSARRGQTLLLSSYMNAEC